MTNRAFKDADHIYCCWRTCNKPILAIKRGGEGGRQEEGGFRGGVDDPKEVSAILQIDASSSPLEETDGQTANQGPHDQGDVGEV